jgi:hypothetical protein
MKIITVTPAGRKRYLEILVRYLLENRQYISEHHFWLNTGNRDDIDYIETLAAKHPDFFKINRKDLNKKAADRMWQFFGDYVDDDTIYIKFDDDMCFFEKDAVKNLIEYRIANQRPLFVFGNIVNNAVCSYFFQQEGIIPSGWGRVEYNCLDDTGWQNPQFAGKLHEMFLKDIKSENLERWKIHNVVMDDFRRFSINVMCWFGRDLKDVPELLSGFDETIDERTGKWRFPHSDESFLSQDLPQRLERPNEICGIALFSHFAFYIQRDYLDSYTVLLEDYKDISFKDACFAAKMNIQKDKLKKNVKKHYYLNRKSVGNYIKNNFPEIHRLVKKVKKREK